MALGRRRPVLVGLAALALGFGAPAAVALDDPPPLIPVPTPTPAPTPAPAPMPAPQSASDLDPSKLPDLGLARIGDLRLVRSPSDALQLRFSSTLVNLGPGPMIVRATRNSPKGTWTVAQRVFTDDGRRPFRTVPVGTVFAGDGHLHWHIRDIVRYSVFSLKELNAPGGVQDARRARKVGFCIYDNDRRKPREGTPSRAVYLRDGCGMRDSKLLRMGLSVGWGDKYTWTLPGQFVDLTGLRAGDYRLLGVANPGDLLYERNTTNNLVFADFRLRRENGKASIRILRQGVRPPGTTAETTAMAADAHLHSSADAPRGVDYAAWPSTPAPSTQSSRTRSRKGRSPA
ncbi:MAG TPA: lysyl oxidase family protein [Sporichthya sp.]|nr:lysyl oxidase family protein [Sporichthya sp.]